MFLLVQFRNCFQEIRLRLSELSNEPRMCHPEITILNVIPPAGTIRRDRLT
jgi:hypothetical protein